MIVLTAYIWRDDDGTVTASVTTTPEVERVGVPHADHRWTVSASGDDSDHGDAVVGTALGCAALGSRLLRLASEINSQRQLFTVRDLGGVGK